MNLLGLTITRSTPTAVPSSAVDARAGWWTSVRESFSGAWQRGVEVDQREVFAFHAIFACMTLIAGDIAKLRIKLVKKDADGIWQETTSPAYSPLLRKPNGYQTRIQFLESWVLSKLARGNTYVLKVRDNRNVVIALHVLDPARVRPMVTEDGSVYYELKTDNLAGIADTQVLVPAGEIIHDRFNCLYHPLVGLSPIYASGLAATQGLRIQDNSANFFANASKPGGLLIAAGDIQQADADRLKVHWNENFHGRNAGKIAVLGNGLKYEGLTVDPVDAQLVEQLKWTAEVVCSTFHVPPYKIGVGALPAYNNVQALNVEYFSQSLQVLAEAIEACLDDGLATGDKLGTELDTDNLLRMDSITQMDVLDKARSVLTLRERRARLDAPRIKGDDTIYLQEQDHSLAAIAARDQQLIALASAPPPAGAAATDSPPPASANDNGKAASLALSAAVRRSLREQRSAHA